MRCALALAALVVAIVPGAALGSPPSNDYFVNAEAIDGRYGWVYGENTDATKEPGKRIMPAILAGLQSGIPGPPRGPAGPL